MDEFLEVINSLQQASSILGTDSPDLASVKHIIDNAVGTLNAFLATSTGQSIGKGEN